MSKTLSLNPKIIYQINIIIALLGLILVLINSGWMLMKLFIPEKVEVTPDNPQQQIIIKAVDLIENSTITQ